MNKLYYICFSVFVIVQVVCARKVRFPLSDFTVNVGDGSDFDSVHGGNEFWNLVEKQQWELNTFKAFKASIHLNTTVIDFGSWIGPTVLYAANLAKAVYSFEPDSVAYRLLVHNIKLNPDIAIKINHNNKCISTKEETVHMKTGGETLGDILIAIFTTQ